MAINLLELQPNKISVNMKDYVIGMYAPPGFGKTSTAAQFPKPLFVATDIGYKTLNVHAQPVFSWVDILTLKAQLANPAIKEKFETIVIDTVDMMLFYLTEHICQTNGVTALGDIPYGKGHADMQKALRKFFSDIQGMGYGIVLLLHSTSTQVGEDKNAYTRMDVKLGATIKTIIVGMMDLLAYIHMDDDNNRFLCFQPTKFYNAKTRFTEIVDHTPLSYANLETAIVDAVQKAAEKFGTETVQKSVLYDEKEQVTQEEFLSKKEEALSLAGELMAEGKIQLVQDTVTGALGAKKLSETMIDDYDNLISILAELSLHI